MGIPSISETDQTTLLEKGTALWSQLHGRKIFVTGGTGFFGKWITQALILADEKLGLNLQLTLLVRDQERVLREQPWLQKPCVRLLVGDVLSSNLRVENQDYVIHAATTASAALNADAPTIMADTILDGTRNVLNMVAGRDGQRPRFLFVSSGAVYGDQPSTITHQTETFLGAPDISRTPSAYGEAKRMAELYCQFFQAAGRIELSIARCYAFVGPYLPLDTHFAAGNFLSDVLSRRTIVLRGDGTPYRSYMHPIDLVLWLMHIVVNVGDGRAFNVGSDDDINLRDLAGMLDEMRSSYGLELEKGQPGFQVLKESAPGQKRVAYIPSIEKARKDLGLSLHIGTQEAFRRTLEWHLQNQNA